MTWEIPRTLAASCSSQGRIASSRAYPVEFSGEASPRLRHSSARPAPARRKAYSTPPRSADSWPGRASTTRTLPARGSHPAGGAAGGNGGAEAMAELIGVPKAARSARSAAPGWICPFSGAWIRGWGRDARAERMMAPEARRNSSLTYRTTRTGRRRAVRILPGRRPRAAVTSLLAAAGLRAGPGRRDGRWSSRTCSSRSGLAAKRSPHSGQARVIVLVMSSSLSPPGKPVAVKNSHVCCGDRMETAESGGHRSHRQAR